jgi:hypothetical protein
MQLSLSRTCGEVELGQAALSGISSAPQASRGWRTSAVRHRQADDGEERKGQSCDGLYHVLCVVCAAVAEVLSGLACEVVVVALLPTAQAEAYRR